ncbi:4-Cys prefix domain-containing protein [Aerosakkonema funiforme]
MSYCLHPNCQKPTCNSTETIFCQSCGAKLLS